MNWADISGQILATIVASLILYSLTWVYKNFSESLAKFGFYLAGLLFIIYMFYQVYVLSGNNLQITILVFCFFSFFVATILISAFLINSNIERNSAGLHQRRDYSIDNESVRINIESMRKSIESMRKKHREREKRQ